MQSTDVQVVCMHAWGRAQAEGAQARTQDEADVRSGVPFRLELEAHDAFGNRRACSSSCSPPPTPAITGQKPTCLAVPQRIKCCKWSCWHADAARELHVVCLIRCPGGASGSLPVPILAVDGEQELECDPALWERAWSPQVCSSIPFIRTLTIYDSCSFISIHQAGWCMLQLYRKYKQQYGCISKAPPGCMELHAVLRRCLEPGLCR